MASFSSTTPEVLEPWVTKIFFKHLNKIETLYTKIFNIKTSTKAFEDTFSVSTLGTFALKPEGQPISYDDPVQSLRKRVVHSTYALGFRATMELMQDDQHGIISQMPADLGDSAADYRERLAFGVLADAFAGATYTGIAEGDGTRRSLCNTGHIRLKDGGTSSNRLNPDVAISVSGIESAVTNFRLTQQDSGRYVNLTPKHLLFHPNDEFTVATILESTLDPNSSDNAINTVSQSRLGLDGTQVPYFTDTDNWFITATKEQHTLTWYNRMKINFERNKDAQTKDALFDAVTRSSTTFDRWEGIVGSAP